MKTKAIKLALVALAAALWSHGAQAYSYLLWQVQSPLKYAYYGQAVKDPGYVQVWLGNKDSYGYGASTSTDGNYLSLYSITGDAATGYESSNTGYNSKGLTDGAMQASYWGNVDIQSNYAFFFEVYSDSGTYLGYLMQEASWIAGAISGAEGTATPYTLTQIIPEPSSGVLALLGFGVLGLKRKKRA